MLHSHGFVWLLGWLVMGTHGTLDIAAATTPSLTGPMASTIGITTETLTWTEEEVITYIRGTPTTTTNPTTGQLEFYGQPHKLRYLVDI
ncbi:hypothetical protein PG994_002484 [Apiospora phragmitis]|uniref:Uncharacterized protein n=1 Tax=Apiospora phragmitis TaxID=2905665 RepID=A0ABR1WWJ5_9PEZI